MQMNILDCAIVRATITFTLFAVIVAIFCGPSYAEGPQPGSGAAPGDSDLQSGQKFEIVGELYAHGVTTDPRSGKLSFIALHQFRIRGHEIISRQLVPIGSILTIVGKEPQKRAFFVFPYPDRYVVHVNTIDAPAGIPIELRLGAGLEGKLTPLNPLIFKPLLDQPRKEKGK